MSSQNFGFSYSYNETRQRTKLSRVNNSGEDTIEIIILYVTVLAKTQLARTSMHTEKIEFSKKNS